MTPLPDEAAAEGLPAQCGRRVLYVNAFHGPRKTARNRNRDGFGFERKGLAGWRTCMQNGDEDGQFPTAQRRLIFCVCAAVEQPDPNPGLARRAAKYLPKSVGKACRRRWVEFGVRGAHPLDINDRHVLWAGAQATREAAAGCAQWESTEPWNFPRRSSLQIARAMQACAHDGDSIPWRNHDGHDCKYPTPPVCKDGLWRFAVEVGKVEEGQ